MSKTAAPRDAHLVQRATSGDKRAFSAIFKRYHQSLYRYCTAILGDPNDAQDALQNTMVKVLRSLPGEKRQIELKPWLYRIAHNEAIDLQRRRRGDAHLDPELVADSALTEQVEARERLRELIGDLEQLPERQRGALVMRELSGLSFEEIASALDTSPAVARQTVYEARLSLRQMEEGREMRCEEVTRALSDADGRVTRRRDIRAHLRHCPSCQSFRGEIAGRERDLSALAPLPALAAAGLLHGVLGSQGGGGIAGALGGGAAKSLGASAALKAAATVAVVAAIGTAAADRSGLVDVGVPGGGGSSSAQTSEADGGSGDAVPTSTQGDSTGEGRSTAGGLGHRSGLGQAEARSGQADRTAVPPAGGDAGSTSPSAHSNGHSHQNQGAQGAAHGKSAAHKAASHGKSVTHGHGAHPPKPHPTHPSKPSHSSNPPQAAEKPPKPPTSAGEGPPGQTPDGQHSTGRAASESASDQGDLPK